MGHIAVVLGTGAAGELGARAAEVLRDDHGVSRVIRVADLGAGHPTAGGPDGESPEDVVRLDIHSAQLGALFEATSADTVVHLGLHDNPHRAGGRGSMKEANVVGAIQVLSACQRSRTVQKLIVQSTSVVYGITARQPAVFTEEMESRASHGFGRDAIDVEGYVRSLGRRRPDITVSVLRYVNILGPGVDTALARYFSMPMAMTVVGYDPRLQFLHATDAAEAIRRMVADDHPGTFNVTGRGVMLLSQCLRRASRLPLPMPAAGLKLASSGRHRWKLPDFSRDNLELLKYGQVVDGTKLERELGWHPAYTTAEAFSDFVAERGLRPGPASELLNRTMDLLASASGSSTQ
jgi:UDP-glucose 4-epimerase